MHGFSDRAAFQTAVLKNDRQLAVDNVLTTDADRSFEAQ
jgi:hypothetical protein